MGLWHAEQSRAFGVSEAELFDYTYGHSPESLLKKFSTPGAGFFLARFETRTVGASAMACQMTALRPSFLTFRAADSLLRNRDFAVSQYEGMTKAAPYVS